MPDTIPDDLLGLQEPNLTPPKSRMESADDARGLLRKWVREDQSRSIQRTLCKGNLDGNPPFGGMNKKFAPWSADINFLTGRARIQAAMNPRTALYAGVDNYFIVTPETRRKDKDSALWGQKLTYHFQKLIKTWGGWDWHQRQRIKQQLIEGWAPVIFDGNDDDWRFRACDAACVYVPRGTPSALDERTEAFILLVPYRTHELWKKIADEDKARKRGWNPQAVKWAIKNGASSIGGVKWQMETWEVWQDMFQRRDLYAGYAQSDTVFCAHLYVQEYAQDGAKTISHFMFTQDDYGAPDSSDRDFLFKQVRRYESYDEACIVYFRDIGDGTWHSVRGLAMESFRHDVLLNRLKSRAADRMFLDSTTLIASSDQRMKDKQEQLNLTGSVTFLAADSQILQSGFNGNINSVLEGIRLFSNEIDANTSSAQPRTIMREDGRGEQPTKFAVQAQMTADASLSQGEIRLEYLTSDRLGYQMWRRAAKRNTSDKEAKEFQEACLDDDIPEDVLYGKCCVTANRLSGYGSTQMRKMAVERLLQLAPMMPEEGKSNVLDDAIVSETENPELINRYNPKTKEVTDDDQVIVFENASVRTGVAPKIKSGQNNVNHMIGHIEDAKLLLEPIAAAMEEEEGAPQGLEEAFQYLSIMAPHLEEHLSLIEQDPSRKPLAQQFRLEIKTLTAFHGKLRQAIRTAQAQADQQAMAEQNANALGVEQQVKVDGMLQDMQLRKLKAANDQQIKESKAVAQNQLKAAQTIGNEGRLNAETIARIKRENIEAAAKMEREKNKPKTNGSK